MATPTPMKHAASQQGRTPSQLAGATPPVSTPFSNPAQAAFSPRGPKSSPQQVRKSPATSAMMGQSALGAFNFDSPSTAAAMGALSIGNSFDMGLDNVGGLDPLGAAIANDDDKLKRLDTILKILSEKRGLVSEASLERLVQRVGLELLSEEQRTPSGRKTRTLVIAGSAIAIDIVLDNNVVKSVSLSYHGSASSVSKHMDEAGKILFRDLHLDPGQSPLTKTLDSFAKNFKSLASLDKLSIVPGLDCYEALAGIYDSLERLYEWDLSKIRQEPGTSEKPNDILSALAMCTRNGRPVMHAQGKVGPALQYWKEWKFVPASTVDPERIGVNDDKTWAFLLGCAPLDGMGVPPVRVSENWISKDVIKEDNSVEPAREVLDWQEPDNVSLPQSEENKDAGMDLLQPDLSTTRVPRVMFTATFEPPMVLPQNDWARLYMSVNVNPPNPQTEMNTRGQPSSPPTFDSLLFPFPTGAKVDPSEPRAILRTRNVNTFQTNSTMLTAKHNSTLYIYKPIYSQVVSEIPFSHPRQLVEMLPLLRQYAFLSILLENSFGTKTQEMTPAKLASAPPDDSPSAAVTTEDKLADFENDDMTGALAPAESFKSARANAPTAAPTSEGIITIDVILWVHPTPQLQVAFPLGDSTADISLKILEDGVVEIVDENIIGATDKSAHNVKEGFTREKMGKTLEVMEDLSKWAEWMRSRLYSN